MVKFGIGQGVTRFEDAALIRGQGRYTDDIRVANAAHAYVLRSPQAHASITRVDISAAKGMPGVLAVLTGKDVLADGLGDMPCLIPLNNIDGTPRGETPRPILCPEVVRHVGDPVALVVAETWAQARDAAEAIEVDYGELPAIVDAVAATRDGAARIWPRVARNLCFDWERGDKQAVDAAFGRAAHVCRLELVNNRVVVNSMEPRAAICDYDLGTDRSTLYTPSQGPHVLLPQIAGAVLKIDKAKLRCVTTNVGGGFGMKLFLHPEQCLVVWASRRLKRAVRWTAERAEAFVSDVQGRDNVSIAELALDKDAVILALKVTTYANLGAYLSNYAPFIPTNGSAMLVGLYKTPAIYANIKGVLTNTVPVDAYRGAGRPEAIYLIERLIDAAGRQLGLGPDEIRRRNFVTPNDLPYKTPFGDDYDSGDFPGIMDACMARADWDGFAARRVAAAARGVLRGIGMATYIERCGGGAPESAILKIDTKGGATLLVGAQDNGQGHVTSFLQILAESLGLDPNSVNVVQGDTDVTPAGFTGGSRALAVGGAAVLGAAEEIVAKGKAIAANAMEAAVADIEFGSARFTVAGTDRGMTLAEVAAAAQLTANLPPGAPSASDITARAAPAFAKPASTLRSGSAAAAEDRSAGEGRSPPGMAVGLEATFKRTPTAPTFPNGCHIAEVEIDRDTGQPRIVRYTVVDDFGRTINPIMLAGQVHGGTAQGIGQALLERTVYDPDSGQLLSGSLMDYALPRAEDIPSFDFSVRNRPCITNPLGVKGAGEAGAVGAPPAVINAVIDALTPLIGATHIDMPARAETIWRLLQEKAQPRPPR